MKIFLFCLDFARMYYLFIYKLSNIFGIKFRILAVIFSIFEVALFAGDIKTYNIDEVITTGNALESPISKIPGNVSIVAKKDISQNVDFKIADSIKRLAGARISNDASFNPRPSIKLRGINYGTLIMLDGVILSDLEGENRLLNQISLDDVSRIEVARGAFSSLYGTNAIGGVINFITSMPSDFESMATIGYGNAFFDSEGEKNLMKMYFNIGNAFFDKRLRVKFSTGLVHSQGMRNVPAWSNVAPSDVSGYFIDKAGNVILGDAGRREWELMDMRVKIEYDIDDTMMIKSMLSVSNHNYEFVNPRTFLRKSDGSATFIANYDGVDIDNFVGSGYAGIGTYTHILGNISLLKDFENANFRFNISSVNLASNYQDADNSKTPKPNFANGPGASQDINTSSNYFDMLYSYFLNQVHIINSAIQFKFANVDQLNRAPSNWRDFSSAGAAQSGYGGMAFVASAFVDLNSSWGEKLSTTFGLRYDYWLDFNGYSFGGLLIDSNASQDIDGTKIRNISTNNFSPKFSINYRPYDFLTFKASIGSAFRMPTYRERYRISFGKSYEINPYLKPESGIGFEFGAEYKDKNRFLSVYYYETDLFDMIYMQGNGSTQSPYKNVNAGFGRIYGSEVTFGYNILDSLKIEGNYTLTIARILKNDTNPKIIGNQLPNTPMHMGNISLIYSKNKGIYGSIWAFMTSSFYNDDANSPILYHTFGYYDAAFSLNVKLGYIFSNHIDLSASLLNVTNNQYFDYYQVPGISYFFTCKYSF